MAESRLNKRKPVIKGYEKILEDDYVEAVQEGESIYGLCEIEGIRYPYQEDVLICSSQTVAELPGFSDENIRLIFAETFAELQKKWGAADYMGATCCSVTAWKNNNQITIWTANLGDSAAFLIVFDKNGKFREAKQLTELHDLASEAELNRFKQLNIKHKIRDRSGKIRNVPLNDYIQLTGRLPTGINVSRGFGDIDSEEYGFSHKPDIVKHEFNLNKGDKAFVIAACDGLTEEILPTAADIARVVSKHQNKPLEEIAEALVNAAFNEGSNIKDDNGETRWDCSTDNISTGIFIPGEQAASITVLDGHGGCYKGYNLKFMNYNAGKLTKNIAMAFYPALDVKIKMLTAIANLLMRMNAIRDSLPKKKDIDNLIRQIEVILNSDAPIISKFLSSMQTIDDAYMKEQKSYTRPSFRRKKNVLDFINKLDNADPKFQYARILKELKAIFPDAANRPLPRPVKPPQKAKREEKKPSRQKKK